MSRILIVTPACNEAEHLEALGQSLQVQKLRPDHWVIVTNGCVDGTEKVADSLAAADPGSVSALHVGATGRRSFAAKAHAVRAGVQSQGLERFDLVACIDADVVLPANYFAQIAAAMDADPLLGIAGGAYHEPVGDGGRIARHRGGHVPGPGQVFRAEVYQAVGGYQPLEFGGLDSMACYDARRLGWETRTIDGLVFGHVRPMGTGGGTSPIRAEYRKGRQDWDLGNAVWFEAAKVVRRLKSPPILAAAVARAAGFVRGAAGRRRGPDPEFVAYVRSEQRQRLAAKFGRTESER